MSTKRIKFFIFLSWIVLELKIAILFIYKTDFEGCYIEIKATLKLKKRNFDKCIDFRVKQLRVAYFQFEQNKKENEKIHSLLSSYCNGSTIF